MREDAVSSNSACIFECIFLFKTRERERDSSDVKGEVLWLLPHLPTMTVKIKSGVGIHFDCTREAETWSLIPKRPISRLSFKGDQALPGPEGRPV